MFIVKEDQYFKYVDDFNLNIYNFVSFLNLLLENKFFLDKILKFSIKEKNPYLILSIKHILENSLYSQLYDSKIFSKLLGFISIFKITFLNNLKKTIYLI